jgi:hypothetical protein
MVRTFLKVYMELGSYFLFLQEQIKDIIISVHGFFDCALTVDVYNICHGAQLAGLGLERPFAVSALALAGRSPPSASKL